MVEIKRLKQQKCDKKAVQCETHYFLHNKGENRLRECPELNNEQNESAISDVVSHSSSYQSLQKEINKKVHKLTSHKEGFVKENSSTVSNDLNSCINTNSIPIKNITMEDSSRFMDPDSPDTMISKSSESVRRCNVM